MTFVWKILEVLAKDGRVTGVRYQCDCQDVRTEGYYTFKKDQQGCEYKDINETLLVHWLHLDMGDQKSLIEANLERQLNPENPTKPPWHVETFKVTL